MKQMRLLIAAAAALLMVGCLQDKVGGVKVYSEPSAELYSISNQASMFLFHSSGPWKATSSEPWLKVIKESGPGGTDTLKVITTEKNLTGQERRAQVTIMARPSAGVAITLAIISALSKKPVSQDIGMTGEVTLRGLALPIGGLREKSLAALRSGLKTIIVPFENKKDVEELPQEVKKKLKIIFMKNVDDAYNVVFKK